MGVVLRFFKVLIAWLHSAHARRDAEILYLRQQLIVLIRTAPVVTENLIRAGLGEGMG